MNCAGVKFAHTTVLYIRLMHTVLYTDIYMMQYIRLPDCVPGTVLCHTFKQQPVSGCMAVLMGLIINYITFI